MSDESVIWIINAIQSSSFAPFDFSILFSIFLQK